MELDADRRRLSLNPRDPAFYQDPYPTYARLLQVAFPVLLSRLPSLALDEPPGFKNSYHFRGLKSLWVTY